MGTGRPRGRPKMYGFRVPILMSPALVARLDYWQRGYEPSWSRSDTIRHAIEMLIGSHTARVDGLHGIVSKDRALKAAKLEARQEMRDALGISE